MNIGKKKLMTLYEACKVAQIGSLITCPSCNTQHTKNAYNTVFCKTQSGTKCKDNYWNHVDKSKRDNRTRISPANARYYNSIILPREAAKRGYPTVDDMLNAVDDTDSMSCYVEPCSCCGLKYEYCRCDFD